MADATLADVVKKLDQVKSAVKAGEVATGAEAGKAAESAAEGVRAAAELKAIFEDIRDNTEFKPPSTKPDEGEGFGMMGLKIAALILAAGAGIVAGLTVGFIDFYKSIFKLAGKGINKLTPKW